MCGIVLITRYLRPSFRYILSIPLSIIALYSLLVSITPSYSTGPDKHAFFQTQQNKIVTMSPIYTSQEYIQIQANDTNEKIVIITGQQEQELLKEKTLVQYISPTT